MGINVSNATAICHDCKKPVAKGNLEINLDSWFWIGALARGKLFSACQDHHNQMRLWGRADLPQHDIFTIKQGLRVIGEFSAPRMVSEVGMSIADGEIQNQLCVEARAISKEKFY